MTLQQQAILERVALCPGRGLGLSQADALELVRLIKNQRAQQKRAEHEAGELLIIVSEIADWALKNSGKAVKAGYVLSQHERAKRYTCGATVTLKLERAQALLSKLGIEA